MCNIAKPNCTEELVDGAFIGEHPGPCHARGRARNDTGQEQADLREAASHLGFHVFDEHGDDQTEHDRNDGEEDDQIERVQDRTIKVGIGEHCLVVAESDESAFVDAIPVVQRIPDGLHDWPEFEYRVKQQRRQEEQQTDCTKRHWPLCLGWMMS